MTTSTGLKHPRHLNSLSYYHACLRLLIDSVRAGLSHASIAKALNASQLPSPAGAKWSTASVKQALHRIQTPDRPSRLYYALARLHLVGMLSLADCQVLTQRGYSDSL
ncbi:recombinase family protein [Cupriavidus necator]|uniref:recombinase family protein n=1 Tax=Cupriavidus necator TaxID=106590 RepID=UPI00059FEA84|nr:recombinase family protein [Cupriavidus necator]